MTLKELFDQGGNAVGNIIVLRGGSTFLIGDATPQHGPSNKTGNGWDGWLNMEVLFVANVFEKIDPAFMTAIQMRAAL